MRSEKERYESKEVGRGSEERSKSTIYIYMSRKELCVSMKITGIK